MQLFIGVASTAQGAWLLARSLRCKGIVFCWCALTMKSLERMLDRLPSGLLLSRGPVREKGTYLVLPSDIAMPVGERVCL